jgi:hypothetical protein
MRNRQGHPDQQQRGQHLPALPETDDGLPAERIRDGGIKPGSITSIKDNWRFLI